MSAATHDDVVELLGDIDELFIERLVDTGATVAEIAGAIDDLEAERRFDERQRPELAPRVAAVREVLEEIFDEEDEDTPPSPDDATT